MLDITTTATVRPSLFYRTLESFVGKLFNKKRCRLILNIDPIGEDIDPIKVVDVAKHFFDNIIFNIPDSPNFAKAIKWCWKNTNSEFVFHLEDDWLLSRNILIDDMLSVIGKYNNMMMLRLPKLSLKRLNKQNKLNKFIRYHKLVLNPSIFRGDFIRYVSNKMNVIDNPERQLRRKFKLSDNNFTGIYCGLGEGEYIRHTGRKWQKQSNYHKIKGSNFITWEKIIN